MLTLTRAMLGYVFAVSAIPATSQAIEVPRWQPHDFAFLSDAKPDNPFSILFSAAVTGPAGRGLTIPGFFDGDGTWKIRVSAAEPGNWTLVTHSTLAALDNQRLTFTCVANPSPNVHGGLRVDPKHPRHFVFEDGSRFFLMGYECDWLWALDMGSADLKTIDPFLDKLSANGFNYVILNAYAHDTDWRKGKTADDDFGPPAMFAWEGSNDKPDHTRFNPAYWRHYDRVIDALYRRGMVAHIMIKVYNKMVNGPANGSADDDMYFRWLIARYSAYPNIHWDLSKEANNEKDLSYKIGRLNFIRQNDPYHRPLTVHDDRKTYDDGAYNDLLDYRSDQQHSKWHETELAHRRQREWPVVNVELGYEHGPMGPSDKTYNVVQPPEEVCRRAWEVCMAGGYSTYYYTYTAWDVIRPQDSPPGYAYFKNLRDFFETTAYWRLEPADDLTTAGYCLAEPGREYIVFLNKPRPFTLKLRKLESPLKAEWYHPFTAKRLDAGLMSGDAVELAPPEGWGDAPVVLHVGSAER